MRIFVTGASGFIGSALVTDLLAAGHQVLGLARSKAAAATLTQLGAEAHQGDLTNPEGLGAAARACDGVAHLGFIHDFSQFQKNVEIDQRAVETLIAALEGSGKPLIVTVGTAMLPGGQIATEADAPIPGFPRSAAEALTLAAAACGVRSSMMRLPPTVHGAGDHGFVPMLIDFARRTGFAAYIGDGANVWPAVHRIDAARLYRLALEQAEPGTVLHAVAEQGIPMRTIAETIAAGLNLPARGLTPEEAATHLGWMARFVAINNPTSSAQTRATFGWNPTGPDLLTDMRDNGYFG